MGTQIEWKIEQHEQVDSTNTLAMERVRAAFSQGNERVHGTVIVAALQSAGRGQHGRSWESPPGGLYLSAIVEDVAPAMRFMLPLFAGVAVSDALHALSRPNAEIRWPNDILLGGKKIAGVLCESVAQGDRWAGIIGIGLNVHIPVESLPPALQGTATSLHLHPPTMPHHTHTIEPMTRVLCAVVHHLQFLLMGSRKNDISFLLEEARRRDCLCRKRVDFLIDDRLVTGTAAGISDAGELLIAIDNHVEAFSRGTLMSVDGIALRH